MKHVSLLSSATMAAFAGILFVAAANIAHAENDAAARNAAAQTNSQKTDAPADKPAWGGNEAAKDRGSWFSRIFGSSAPKSAPSGQTDSSGWSSSKEGHSGCGSNPDEEDFLCKLARIFWGPDTPSGPNQDMDSNITAGGAGG